jgi:hypothetical protein
MNRIYALVALGSIVSSPAYAGPDLQNTFGWSGGEVCVIKHNNGGGRFPYERAAAEVNNGDCGLVVVDGPCTSNCTYFLNLVKAEKVCVTKFARLAFHIGQATEYPTVVLATGERGMMTLSFKPPYTGKVAEWIQNRGGLSRELKVMYAEDAARIWRWCSKEVSRE